MIYQEVKEILGREGEIYIEYSSLIIENFGVVYCWVNNDGIGIVVVFNFKNKLIKLIV